MKKTNLFKIYLISAFVCLGTLSVKAQCPGGQVEVTLDVTTDTYGYETIFLRLMRYQRSLASLTLAL